VTHNFWQIGRTVRELLEPERFRGFRARVSAIRNTAVYEIPDVLEKILGSYFPPQLVGRPPIGVDLGHLDDHLCF